MIEIPGYRVLAPLGRGGMASVYLAEQLSLHRQVALKVLAPQLASDPTFVERFLREGRVAARLRHRHIVAIHDVGVHQGVAYMALDYLPGGSLASQGTLAPREALRVLREIGSALDLAHRSGVVHRDIKPENILIDEDGRHVLSDFGIARIAHASQAMTREGTTVGTPAYMAPEQWRAEAVDGRADLYSLGVVLFQLLTGRVPYNGTDGWAIGMQHMQAPLPQLPETLRALQPLLDRLLA
ncbi:MAG: serine/threonine protein kinase, partial [Rhodanobacteraceae bacterium]|nr:serine/threonine protein kinase [Rhodanobacteraceae bacterium]